MFNTQKIAQFCTVDAEGINFSVDVSDKGYIVAGAKVLEVGMFVSNTNEAEEGGDASYFDGDMYVSWSAEGLTNDETAQTIKTSTHEILLRNLHSEDDVTKVMGEFYWESAFTDELRSILVDCGFSAEAAACVSTSEWGMQDEERASYDAYSIADEIREAVKNTVLA
jgi:hypothetical protein